MSRERMANLAIAYGQRVDEMIEDLRELAVQINHSDEPAWHWRGVIEDLAHDWQAARDHIGEEA